MNIQVFTDEKEGTFTIQDSGVGLSHDEMIQNLGTIAFSGSKKFMQEVSEAGSGSDAVGNIIGQFGVGFYSAFMVADEVQVYSQSAKEGEPGWVWTSSGDGTYKIDSWDDCSRGSKIVLRLKENAREFANAATVKDIIEKYSNFVAFPISLNGEQVRNVD